MKKRYLLIVPCFFIIIFSCKNDINKEPEFFTGNTIKKRIYKNKNLKYTAIYSFYDNGEIKAIHRYDENGKQSGEQLWFDSNGILEKKIPLINDKAEGNGYFFYAATGTLAGQRFYRNDIAVFHGITYWEDSLPMIHAILYYNDSGNVYYSKSFDKYGNFIGEEGREK